MHQFRDKRQIQKRKHFIKIILVCSLFVIFSVLGFLSWTGKIFTSIGRPVWKIENNVSAKVENLGYIIRSKKSVFSENDSLKSENSQLKLSMIDYQVLKKENEELKELFGRVGEKHNFIIGSILSRPNRSPYDTIVIDAGSQDNVKEGQVVYANGNIPIGKVSSVYLGSSLVMLYSNPGQITEGLLSGSNASVELIGRGGGNFEMSIPIDLDSTPGNVVVSPGITSEVLAIIDDVISIPTDPIKKIILHSPINIQNLKWVEVRKD